VGVGGLCGCVRVSVCECEGGCGGCVWGGGVWVCVCVFVCGVCVWVCVYASVKVR